MCLTSDGAANLPSCFLTSLHRGLLTVPGCVWSTDQVGCILQRACWKAVKNGKGCYREEWWDCVIMHIYGRTWPLWPWCIVVTWMVLSRGRPGRPLVSGPLSGPEPMLSRQPDPLLTCSPGRLPDASVWTDSKSMIKLCGDKPEKGETFNLWQNTTVNTDIIWHKYILLLFFQMYYTDCPTIWEQCLVQAKVSKLL